MFSWFWVVLLYWASVDFLRKNLMLSGEDLKDLREGENIIKIYLNSKVVLNNENIIRITRIRIEEYLLFLQIAQVWFKSPM